MSFVDGSNVTIGHLGIVAGMFDTLGIGDYIDSIIPKKRKHLVSHGTVVKALLMNGLGFVERRLYLMPDYFDDIATERLLGSGIQPDNLNEYLFGETLDAIATYGPTRLFTELSLKTFKSIKYGVQRLHHDTTSINVTGDYDSDFNTRLIRIVRGHSKDHRNDLKQFLISLVTNQHGIPVFMQPLSGNSSDKKTLLNSIQAVRNSFITDEKIYHMADSAFYTAKNIQTLGRHCFWISHVPATITESRQYIAQDVQWSDCEDSRYKHCIISSSYGGISQRWVMFHSFEQQKRKELKFDKNVNKKMKKDRIALNKHINKGFACEKDAIAALDRWIHKNPRYRYDNLSVLQQYKKKTGTRGRPRLNEPLEPIFYLSFELILDQERISQEKSQLGRFILASNDESLNPDMMLMYYKEQNTVERGFRFLKDSSFHVSEVYLKNNDRIAALSMIMVLCLLVYSLAEWMFRNILKEHNESIRNPGNKQTKRPTMKRVFFLLRRIRQIYEILEDKPVCRRLNLKDESMQIISLFGPPFEKYYT